MLLLLMRSWYYVIIPMQRVRALLDSVTRPPLLHYTEKCANGCEKQMLELCNNE